MASVEDQLRSKTQAVQHLLHKIAVAEAKEEALGNQLAASRAELAQKQEQVQILHEAMEALSEQLKRRTLEAEAAAATAAQTIESLQAEVAELQAQVRTKDETLALLVERLNRYEKTYGLSATGPIPAPTGSPALPDGRPATRTQSMLGGSAPAYKRILRPFGGSGGSSAASATAAAAASASSSSSSIAVSGSGAVENHGGGGGSGSGSSGFGSHFPSLHLPFGGDKAARAYQTRIAKLEEELQAANEALLAHKAQNSILNEEVLQLKLLVGPLEPPPPPPPADAASDDEDGRRRGESEAPQVMASSLKQAMEDDELDLNDRIIKEQAEATLKELSTRLPIPVNAPLVPGYDRYGFMENDALATGSEALLRRIEKRQKEEEYLKYEATQRQLFDAFLMKRGMRLDNLQRSEELKHLIRGGIPREYRAQVWMQVSGANKLKEPGVYESYLNDHANKFSLATQQIELDVHRTLPTNRYFQSQDAPAIPRLRRILTAYSWRNPLVGYCQGMNLLAAALILVLEEEDAFWCFVNIVENMLPPNYFTSNLLVSQADQRVLKELVAEKRPRIIRHMEQEGVDLSLITFNWFLTAFVDCVPPETFYRIWDSFMFEGAKVLFRFALGILRMNEEQILQRTGTGPLFQFLRNMTSRLYNVNELAKYAFAELKPFPKSRILSKRERYTEIVRQELQAVESQRTQMEEQLRAESMKPRQPRATPRDSDASASSASNSISRLNFNESALAMPAPSALSLSLPGDGDNDAPAGPMDEEDERRAPAPDDLDDESATENTTAATTPAAETPLTDPAAAAPGSRLGVRHASDPLAVPSAASGAAAAGGRPVPPAISTAATAAGASVLATSVGTPLAWPSAVMGIERTSANNSRRPSLDPVRMSPTQAQWATVGGSSSTDALDGANGAYGGWDAAPQASATRR